MAGAGAPVAHAAAAKPDSSLNAPSASATVTAAAASATAAPATTVPTAQHGSTTSSDGSSVAQVAGAAGTSAKDGKGDLSGDSSSQNGSSDNSGASLAQQISDAAGASGNSTATATTTAVPLSKAAETLHATVQTMTSQGISNARISLTPESLGGVRVVLTQTDNGLVARVVADHPEAAQTLAESAGELRKSLEASGTNLLRLDIGTSSDQSSGFAQTGSQNGGSQDASQSSGSGVQPAGYDLDDDTEDDSSLTNQLTVTLGDGSLVNVVA